MKPEPTPIDAEVISSTVPTGAKEATVVETAAVLAGTKVTDSSMIAMEGRRIRELTDQISRWKEKIKEKNAEIRVCQQRIALYNRAEALKNKTKKQP